MATRLIQSQERLKMIISNPWYGKGLPDFDPAGVSVAVDAPLRLLQHCPVAQPTPLANCADLAKKLGLASLHIKDERTRMRLGSFKALGAAYAIAKQADAKRAESSGEMPWEDTLEGEIFVTASAGNHGLSVAAGARIFGAKAVIYLSETVPEGFAERLRDIGATVVRAGQDYEASMQAAASAATDNGWTLLSDSSWIGYTELPHILMEGYTALAAEAIEQMPKAPDYIFLQAGVGGLACSAAACFRAAWGDHPQIVVVEPDAAPALYQSIEQGQAVSTSGPVSSMGRLDCKEPSLIALNGLSRDADLFYLMSDESVEAAIAQFSDWDLTTSPSGGAGLAACLSGDFDIGPDSTVLCIISEGA